MFFTRAWNTCTNLRKSTLLLICYFCCPFHCQSHSFLSKEPCFFCFCRWKELFEASYWNLFSTTLWYLSCAPGGARSANSSNVSVRPTSWRRLAYPANQSTSSSSGAGHWYQLAVEHGSDQRVTTQSVKTETATIMGEPKKGGKASAFNRKPLDRRLVREVLKPCLTNNFSIWPISATHL